MKTFKILFLFTLIGINTNPLHAQQKLTVPVGDLVTYITGTVNDSLKDHTITLVLHGPFFYDGEPERGASQILTSKADQYGEFKFKIIGSNSPFHVSLFLASMRDRQSGYLLGPGDVNDYLIEPGDSIHADCNSITHRFSGRGSALFQAQYAVEQADYGNHQLTFDTLDYFNTNPQKWLEQKDSLLTRQLAVLSRFKSTISPAAYAIVRADIIGVNRAWIYRRINFAGPFLSKGLVLTDGVAKLCMDLEQRPGYIDPTDRAALSPKYTCYLYEKLRIEVKYDRAVHHLDVHSDENYFPFIIQQYKGILRDKLLVWWLTRLTAFNDLQPTYIDNALGVMQTPYFIQIAEKLQETYAKGNVITDFGFKDANDQTVHLADFKGKVLVIDLWFSGCHGCLAVAAGLPHVEAAFKNRSDVLFISISIDKERQLWLNSIAKNRKGRHYSHFTTSKAIYLYTGGTAADNPFIAKYVPDGSYPTMLIIDKEARMFSATPASPINQHGQQELIKEINKAIQEKI